MSIQPSQPQSIGGVLDTTFQLYKASLVKLIPLSLLLVIASCVQYIYVFTRGGSPDPADPLAMLNLMTTWGYWLSLLAGVIGSTWITAALYLKVAAIGTDSDLGIGAALQASLPRLPALVLMLILFILAVMLGSLLLIIPGIILMVSLLLCYPTALFDNKGPVSALTESHRLVWGNWWRTLVMLTVGLIILIVIYLVVATIVGLIAPLLMIGGGVGAEDVALYALVSFVLIFLFLSLLLTPFYISLGIAIYWDLKLRKDGGDLAARVGALNPA
jgi:hypothetical protein